MGIWGVSVTWLPMLLLDKLFHSVSCVGSVLSPKPSQTGPPCHILGKCRWTNVPRHHFEHETACHNALRLERFRCARCYKLLRGNRGIRIHSVRLHRPSAAPAPDHVLACVLFVVCAVLAPVPGVLIYCASSCLQPGVVERVSDMVRLALGGPCLGHAHALRSPLGLRPRFLCCALSAGGGTIARLRAPQ